MSTTGASQQSPSTVAAICNACGNPTTKICSGCWSARFCSREYLQTSWPDHKQACYEKGDALIIQRVGELAERMYFLVAEQLHADLTLRIEERGRCRIVIEGPPADWHNTAIIPFPAFRSAAKKKALLSICGCNHALIWQWKLIENTLIQTGHAHCLGEIEVRVHDQPRPAFKAVNPLIFAGDRTAVLGEQNPWLHRVHHLKMLRSQTDWVIDVTGYQYGFEDAGAKTVFRFLTDIDAGWDTMNQYPIGDSARHLNEHFRSPGLSKSLARIHLLPFACAEEVNQALVAFRHEGQPLAHYLRKDATTWDAVQTALLDALTQTVNAHIASLHAEEGPLRRNERSESVFKIPVEKGWVPRPIRM